MELVVNSMAHTEVRPIEKHQIRLTKDGGAAIVIGTVKRGLEDEYFYLYLHDNIGHQEGCIFTVKGEKDAEDLALDFPHVAENPVLSFGVV